MGGYCSSSKQAKRDVVEPSKPTITELSPEEKALQKAFVQLKLIFDSVDAGKSNSVSKDELTEALQKNPTLGALIKDAGLNSKYDDLRGLDTNKDGSVSWEEFDANLRMRAVKEAEQGDLAAADIPAHEKVLKQLRAIFDGIDKDGDHTISKHELQAKLDSDKDENGLMKDGSFGMLVEEAGFNPGFRTFEKLDTKKDGRITWEEFEANLRDAANTQVKETGEVKPAAEVREKVLKQLRAIFDSIDADGDHTISKHELQAKLDSDKDENGLMKDGSFGMLVEEAGFNPGFRTLEGLDTKKDGRITWEEFEKNLRVAATTRVYGTGEVAAVAELEELDDGPTTSGCWCSGPVA